MIPLQLRRLYTRHGSYLVSLRACVPQVRQRKGFFPLFTCTGRLLQVNPDPGSVSPLLTCREREAKML